MNWIINFENGKSPCRVNQAATTVGSFIYSFGNYSFVIYSFDAYLFNKSGGYCQQQTVSELKQYSPIDVCNLFLL